MSLYWRSKPTAKGHAEKRSQARSHANKRAVAQGGGTSGVAQHVVGQPADGGGTQRQQRRLWAQTAPRRNAEAGTQKHARRLMDRHKTLQHTRSKELFLSLSTDWQLLRVVSDLDQHTWAGAMHPLGFAFTMHSHDGCSSPN